MSGSLLTTPGGRDIVREESVLLSRAAHRADGEVATLCLALAFRGTRIFELLAITREHGIVLNIGQRWMGHARIKTSAIYIDVVGREGRALTRRT